MKSQQTAALVDAAPGNISGHAHLVAIYATFATLWILLSDHALKLLFSSAQWLTLANSLKGTLFVLVTSALLYRLLARVASGRSSEVSGHEEAQALLPRGLTPVLLTLTVLALSAATILASFATLRQHHHKQSRELQVAADMTALRAAQWLDELSHQAQTIEAALHRQAASSGNAPHTLDAHWIEHLVGVSSFDSFRLEPFDSAPPADANAAQFDSDAQGRMVVRFKLGMPGQAATLVLQASGSNSLQRDLQQWSRAWTSGDILWFRRAGDRISYLAPPRFWDAADEGHQLPLTRDSLLAAQVLQGHWSPRQLLQGRDYRDQPVIGAAAAIPGTDQFIVAKLSQTDFYTQGRQLAGKVAIVGLLCTLLGMSGFLTYWRRRELSALHHADRQSDHKLRALSLLDAIAHSTTDAIYAKDLQGRMIYANPAAERMSGFTIDALKGKSSREVFDPDLVQQKEALEKQVLKEDRSLTREFTMLRPDGEQRRIELTKSLLKTRSGDVLGMLSVARDVTEQRQQDARREEVATLYRSTYEHAAIGICHVARDSRFLIANPAFCAMTGWKEAELIGASFTTLIHPEEVDAELKTLQEFLTGNKDRHSREVRIIRADGEMTWVAVQVSPVRQADGEVEYLIASCLDISEIRRAQQERLASEARFRQALDAANDGVSDWDLRTGEMYYSARWKAMLGYRCEELSDTPALWRQFTDPQDAPAMSRALIRLATGELDHAEQELRMRHKSGHTIEVLSRAFPIHDPETGKPQRVIGIHMDVTERNVAQRHLQRMQKLEEIGQLTGGLAHDFNNLLSIVIGNLDLLETLPLSDEAREISAIAQSAALRGADLTQSLLAVARRQELAPTTLDLCELLRQLRPLILSTLGARIECRFQIPPQPIYCHVDRSGLESALLNLVVNARDAMPDAGSFSLEVEACPAPPGAASPATGRWLRISVHDSGSGMSPEVQENALNPFFTTKNRSNGTGLGLAMANGFAQQSGGDLTISSRLGAGTTVEVILPQCEAAIEQSPAGHAVAPRGTARILLVDDEVEMLKLSKRWLEAAGHTVVSCSSADQAWETFQQQSFDVLVSDVMMPGRLDGMSLAERCAGHRPGIRVLLTTGYADNLLARYPAEHRPSVMTKPFREPDLTGKLGEVLDATPWRSQQ